MMKNELKTVSLDGAEWLKLTKPQAERLGLGYCWEDGLLVNLKGYQAGMTRDTIYFNAHPLGRTPACEYYEWMICSFAPDDLVDVLVATQDLPK